MDNKDYQYYLKLFFMGASRVGKTSIKEMFCKGNMPSDYLETLGVEYDSKVLKFDDKGAKLIVWDSSGGKRQEMFTAQYWKGTHGALLVYAVNDRDSFNALEKYIKEAADKKIPIVYLVGNKIDESKRVVETSEGQKFADDHQMKFFEISAQDGSAIENIFAELTREIVKNQASKDD